jgi:hypothetical protein
MRSHVIVGGLALTVGFSLGWWMFRPKPAVAEVNAPAIAQGDGSVVLQKEASPKAKARHALPSGARVLRVEEITVTPTSNPEGREVHVDATLVETPDGQTRVVVSSPDGAVTGHDIVVQTKPVAAPTNHTLLGGYDPAEQSYLLGYLRRLGPVSLGGIVTHDRDETRGYLVASISF